MHSNSFDVGLVDNVLNFKIALLRKIRNMTLLFTYDFQTTSSFIFIHKMKHSYLLRKHFLRKVFLQDFIPFYLLLSCFGYEWKKRK